MKKMNNRKIEALMGAILSLKNQAEAKRFLRDLLTENELMEFGNRWQVAQMLDAKVTYAKIEKETGLSARTVARISKWLKGGKGGYRLVLDRLHHSHSSIKKRLSKSG